MAGDVDAPRIGTVIAKMLMKPADGVAHLANDPIHARFGRQGVFDDRHVETVRHRPLGQGAIHFFCLEGHLPITAVDVSQGRRRRIAGEEQVEHFTRLFAIGEAEMPAMPLTKARAARSPVGKEFRGCYYCGEVVVGGVELGAIHSAVQHGFKPLRNSRLWRKQANIVVARYGVKSFIARSGSLRRPLAGKQLASPPPRRCSASPAPDPTAQVLLPAMRSERRRSPECVATGEMRRKQPFPVYRDDRTGPTPASALSHDLG